MKGKRGEKPASANHPSPKKKQLFWVYNQLTNSDPPHPRHQQVVQMSLYHFSPTYFFIFFFYIFICYKLFLEGFEDCKLLYLHFYILMHSIKGRRKINSILWRYLVEVNDTLVYKIIPNNVTFYNNDLHIYLFMKWYWLMQLINQSLDALSYCCM